VPKALGGGTDEVDLMLFGNSLAQWMRN
jgi:hypothetical protein